MERMSIYRMRPMNDRTLEELSEPYLWFSRRCGFKDKKDANVAAIIDKNEELMKVFYEKYGKDQTDILKKALDCTGICCFTKELPTKINWCKFPHATAASPPPAPTVSLPPPPTVSLPPAPTVSAPADPTGPPSSSSTL